MRCSRRSTIWFVSAVLLALAAPRGARADGPATDDRVPEALAAAVRERMGEVEVRIDDLLVRLQETDADAMIAVPAPRAQLGSPARFLLYEAAPHGRRGPRVGSAEAIVRVVAPHARAVRPIERGTTLGEADLAVETDLLGSGSFERLPSMQELVGSTARRDLGAGDVLDARAVIVPPPVTSGQTVVLRAQVGAVVATASAVAAQTGSLDDVITVVNQDSGRRLTGRVVGRGEVEVVP